jgi:hypothetical protein
VAAGFGACALPRSLAGGEAGPVDAVWRLALVGGENSEDVVASMSPTIKINAIPRTAQSAMS